MKIPKTLQQSIDAVNESIATSQRSESALASEVATLAITRAEVQTLEATLQEALTAAALGEPAGDTEAIRSRLADAEKQVTESTRRVAGLETRVKQNRAELEKTGNEYNAQFAQFRVDCMAAENVEVRKAFEVARKAVARALTIGQGLQDNSYLLMFSQAYLPDPDNPGINLLNPVNRNHATMPGWYGDEELTALFNSYSEISKMAAALEVKREKISEQQAIYDRLGVSA